MRQFNKLFFSSMFTFILGCTLSLAVYSNYMSLQCEPVLNSPEKSSIDFRGKTPYEYLVLVLSSPSNLQKRNTIRETWLKLLPNKYIYYDGYKERWVHYFVIGTVGLSDQKIKSLEEENSEYKDIMFLPELTDMYSLLSLKLLESFKWIDNNLSGLLYVIKCDDDSFVRIDLILKELHIMRRNNRKESQDTKIPKHISGENKNEDYGLYWGYFKGNAHVQRKGKWSENEFVLCDRYLPYAQGGGYVVSYDIVKFVGRNAEHLKIFKSEDVAMGVWTAPLGKIKRYHDVRFDTEWESRGCDDSYLIRHKQKPKDMLEMYETLVASGNTRLCSTPSFIRGAYNYNWSVLPSQCCSP